MVLQTILNFLTVNIRPKQNKLFLIPVLFERNHQVIEYNSSKLKKNLSTTICTLALRKTNTVQTALNSNKKALISSLNFRSEEDAAPFYALRIHTLNQIYETTVNDMKNGLCENRLYYISARIQCPPAEISKKLAKRSFVYKLNFDWLESSLNELLEKGVPGDRILRDLWVLRYHHKTIGERLQRIKDHGIDNLFPWMVRCSPDILNRYLKITQETKTILGDRTSTQMYLAHRLNISLKDVEEMCVKIPALKTIRATKVKHFLDFLIDEGFNIEEIAKKPRILAYSQKTVKQRLKELRQLGVIDINLNLLCRSKKDFKRVFENLGAERLTNNVAL